MRRALPVLLALLGAGCISTLAVERVEPGESANGLVYSLPKTYLVVEPRPDGTMGARFLFLPDPENTYAIRASSWFGKHSLDVGLTPGGLLQEVDWKPSNAAVGQKLLEAAAKVQGEKEKAETEREEEREKRRKDAEKRVDDATTKVATARRRLELLRSDLHALELNLEQLLGRPTPDLNAIDALQLAIFRKQEEIRFAQEDLAAAEAELAEAQAAAGGPGPSAVDPATGNLLGASSPAKFPGAWGGVLYEVLEERDPSALGQPPSQASVAAPRLRAVRTAGEPQRRFETQLPPAPKVAAKVTLEIEGGPVLLLPASRPSMVAARNKLELAERRVVILQELGITDDRLLNARLAAKEEKVVHDQVLANETKEGLRAIVSLSAGVGDFTLEFGPPPKKGVPPPTTSPLTPIPLAPTRYLVELPSTAPGLYQLTVSYTVPHPTKPSQKVSSTVALPLVVR